MRILITSGGTKVMIDGVRHISNMSKGTFGSAICKSFLEKGHVAEQGKHDELLQQKGLYYAMWRQQIGERN